MVRRLPKAFREKLYFQYQARYQIPRAEFLQMMEESKDEDAERVHRRQGGPFEQRVASDEHLSTALRTAIQKTIRWPSTVQSIKSALTAGTGRTLRYLSDKREKYKKSKSKSSPTESKSPSEADKSKTE